MMLLTGDIGGTKTWLQLAEVDAQGQIRQSYQCRYESTAYPHLLPMVHGFLAAAAQELAAPPVVACFAIAGPIQGASAQVTNLPWQLDAHQLQNELSIQNVLFINDFAAIGQAMAVLTAQDWIALQDQPEDLMAPRAVIGAGTGLGHCIVMGSGPNLRVVASEAGHNPLAPVTPLQCNLVQYLMQRRRWVSYEQVVSGAGLVTLLEFLIASGRPLDEGLQYILKQGDPAAISAAAQQQHPVALEVIDLWLQCYAQQAANLALTCLAYGGVYIAGGIAPQLAAFFKNGRFIQYFQANPIMGHLLRQMPVRLIIHPQPGLLGAGVVAHRVGQRLFKA